MTAIPGYTPQTAPTAPISLDELALVKKTLLFGADDAAALRRSAAILEPQINAILDTWYGFVGANPQLLESFSARHTQEPVKPYLDAVYLRFGQWIRDTAAANHDQIWLNYQLEIGRRHHRSGKNQTDAAPAAEHISFRYLFALAVPVTVTLKPFLAQPGIDAAEVETMHAAWVKAVLLQVTLWSHPYIKDGDW